MAREVGRTKGLISLDENVFFGSTCSMPFRDGESDQMTNK
jgi:hypothetical protein